MSDLLKRADPWKVIAQYMDGYSLPANAILAMVDDCTRDQEAEAQKSMRQ